MAAAHRVDERVSRLPVSERGPASRPRQLKRAAGCARADPRARPTSERPPAHGLPSHATPHDHLGSGDSVHLHASTWRAHATLRVVELAGHPRRTFTTGLPTGQRRSRANASRHASRSAGLPSSSAAAEQRAGDRWRLERNRVRPHEALQGKTPSELYTRSERRPQKTKFMYPPEWIVRTVTDLGAVNVGGAAIQAGRALVRERVALEPLGGSSHRLWFAS